MDAHAVKSVNRASPSSPSTVNGVAAVAAVDPRSVSAVTKYSAFPAGRRGTTPVHVLPSARAMALVCQPCAAPAASVR
jgi:hypothetical protein